MNDENKLEELFKKYDEKMEQRIVALVAESEKNTQRHTGALSEDFQGKLSGVAEGVVGLGDKMETLTNDVEALTNTVKLLVNKVDQIEGTLKGVVHTQEMHTEMIGGQMEDTSETKIELKNKVDRTEFIELKQTVLAMS